MAFSQAVSGLNAAATNLDVIGNNIANSATSGFKASSASFADIFAGSAVGMGVKVSGVTQDFNDGTPNMTNRALDVAISQGGFFRLQDTAGNIFYSRNGQFSLAADSTLVNSTNGMAVTGYPATGNPPTIQTGSNPVALSIPSTGILGKASNQGTLQASLNSSYDAIPNTTTFSPTDLDSYNDKTSMTTYDSLGNEHQIDLYFVKTGPNAWDVHPIDSSTNTTSPVTSLTFTPNGELSGNSIVAVNMASLNGSATGQIFNLDLKGSIQQNTGDRSSFGNPVQDGYAMGDLTSYQINDDGTVTGNYSNGESQLLGQIVLSNFANVEGLASQGDNVWAATAASGQELIGIAGTGNLGTLTGGALESSNVDLSRELVNMIVAQRNYQSNAQTIKTQDQILNTLVNLR